MAEALVSSEEDPGNEEVPERDTLIHKPQKPLNMSPGAVKLRSWLNKSLQIEMRDGRVLIGVFLCTDRDANVILGSCTEYLPADSAEDAIVEEPRMLGLVMVPGKHILRVAIDESQGDEACGGPDGVMSRPLCGEHYLPEEEF